MKDAACPISTKEGGGTLCIGWLTIYSRRPKVAAWLNDAGCPRHAKKEGIKKVLMDAGAKA